MKVKLGVIAVEDYERARTFYIEKLGCELVSDSEFGEDSRWIELKLPGGDTHIALFTPPGQTFQPNPCSNIAFGCDDMDKKYEELRAHGVKFVQPPRKEKWGVSSLFQDSEGNTFCLSSEN
jgi:predicted enzyme related to lactoylglutathione lyase